ncbi:MAG: cytochrome c biogenesis protein CcdA [Candidatus Omnitrophica bacterium]|jgi:thiol:disulfide interchange protein DsbD|nr:cytochrome c biogenesis protein CcdA [Candidatus Omnitrophota bacterium]MDD5690297.1 cytochrome c biogenesis protein CcdA [Candidatus Omnitrophota bacterium]
MLLSGSPLDFVYAFFGGLLASFTPCVYPLIPISAGYIVGNAQNSKIKGFLLSLFYVTGIAFTYSLLGILAVLTGRIFGEFSVNPIVNLMSGVLILIFGLSMFDLFHLNFSLNLKPPVYKKRNYFLALLLGLISGLMISPCLTPILGAILTYLSTTKNIFYGGLLLLSFSYGMGLIFILIGTFGVSFTGLPKAGNWMLLIKKICAAIIVLTGAYFIFSAIRRF